MNAATIHGGTVKDHAGDGVVVRSDAEATVFTKGPTLRARESSRDMKASIDMLVDKLERQVKRYSERRHVEPRRHAHSNGDGT